MRDLQSLIDQADIKDLHLRYCRGVDRLDWDLVRACYHPDATDDHGAFKGGVEAFLAWVAPALEKYESTTHFTGNQLVEIDGDRAWAEHYARVFHRRGASEGNLAEDLIANVRYVDALERRDGTWRIASRVVVVDSDRSDAVEGVWLTGGVSRGRRDRMDLSYRR